MKKLLLLIIYLASTLSLWAQDFTYEGINYTITDSIAHTCRTKAGTSSSTPGNTGLSGELNIPMAVVNNNEEYIVTEIGNYSFTYNEGLTSLTLPSNLTSIGINAFAGCSELAGSLTIPEGVTSIGFGAFQICSGFTGPLTIPEGVTSIGGAAFYCCSGFTGSLTIPEGVTTIGDNAFEECSGFNGSLSLPSSLTSIGEYAFNYCSGFTGSLTIPEGVTAIGARAFQRCSGFNGTLSLPSTLTSIGAFAFNYCSGFTGSLTIPEGVTSIGNAAFQRCSGFNGTLTLPSSLTSIGQNAFYYCSGFTGSLTIPDSVTSIKDNAFSGSTKFTNVEYKAAEPITASENIFSSDLYNNAFLIVASGGVEKARATTPWSKFNIIIDYDLQADFIYEGINYTVIDPVEHTCRTKTGTNSAPGNTGLSGELNIPMAVVNNNISYIVTEIGEYSFLNNTELTSLTLPSTITNIGEYAFQGCRGFTGSLNIPEGVTSIGSAAFNNCSGFTGSLVIPEGVTSIGADAFSGCGGFTGSLTISEGVTSIGQRAFQGCSGITEYLTIPNSVNDIGDFAFEGCKNISKVKYIASEPITASQNIFSTETYLRASLEVAPEAEEKARNTVPWRFFYDYFTYNGINYEIIDATTHTCRTMSGNDYSSPGNTELSGELNIPMAVVNNNEEYIVTEIGNYSFTYNEGLTSLTLPSNLTSIGINAFAGCSGLTGSLTIPEGVTSIGFGAFQLCSGFTGPLSIPEGVTSIEDGAFNGCIGFTGPLLIPEGVTSIGGRAFYYCYGFTGPLSIPEGVTVIGVGAFYRCSGFTGSLTIPEGVTAIGQTAFSGCSGFDGTLSLPSTLTVMGYEAFAFCSGLTGSLTLPSSLTTISGSAFQGCNGFTGSLTIPGSVTSIKDYAFFGCTFNKVEYKASEPIAASTNIFSSDLYNNAFLVVAPGGVEKARSITPWSKFNVIIDYDLQRDFTYEGINYTVIDPISHTCRTKAGVYSSPGHTGLSGELNIPMAVVNNNVGYIVTEIGDYSFTNNTELTSLTLPSTITNIGKSAFSGCSGFDGTLSLPSSLTAIGQFAFNYCSGFTGSLTIPEGVISIGYATFQNCSGFKGTLTLPHSLKAIGEFAFNYCSGFTGSLTIPEDVTSIGSSAFQLCSSFDGTLTLPSRLTSIGGYAFNQCSGFTGSLTIPEGVTSIDKCAFKECSGITEILTIPGSVTYIGDVAFAGCKSISKVKYFASEPITASQNIFSAETYLRASLEVAPEAESKAMVTEPWRYFYDSFTYNGINYTVIDATAHTCKTMAGSNLFPGNSELSGELSIPLAVLHNNAGYIVTEIGDYSFYNNTELTSLTLPSTITNIGYSAFRYCSGLVGTLAIPTSVTEIGDYAFDECNGFTTVEYKTDEPISGNKNIFSDAVYENAKLIVLPEGVDNARVTEPWMYFNDIEEMEVTGIEDILVDADPDAPVEVYNLNGLKIADSLDNLLPGIYIVRQGSKVRKVITR